MSPWKNHLSFLMSPLPSSFVGNVFSLHITCDAWIKMWCHLRFDSSMVSAFLMPSNFKLTRKPLRPAVCVKKKNTPDSAEPHLNVHVKSKIIHIWFLQWGCCLWILILWWVPYVLPHAFNILMAVKSACLCFLMEVF